MSTVSATGQAAEEPAATGPAAGPAGPAASAGRLATVGFGALLALVTAFSVVWLAIGVVVAAATYWPAAEVVLRGAANGGSAWARGVLAAVPKSEPLGQAVLDYAFSALNLGLAVVLLARARRNWVMRLLALAMVGSAGAFNLQAHGATLAVETAFGVAIGEAHQVQLHGIACAAYVVALLLFPNGRWELGPNSGTGQLLVVLGGVGSLLVVGVGTALLPHTLSCILFFGFLVPVVGLVALPRRIRYGATTELRTQARLLFSALIAAGGTIFVLLLITLLLLFLGQPGLTLVDPTVGGATEPTALLFWFSRLAAVGIAGAALVSAGRGGLWSVERVFSRGLASVLVVVLVGGGYVVARALVDRLSGAPTTWATVFATVLAAAVFLPLYQRVERVVERLLYGARPTPYRVLADVAELSRARSSGGPNLAAVAEAIGQALGARSCQLTVLRPGLRDRTYAWTDELGRDDWADESGPPEDHLVLPIRQGSEQIGTVAVERGAVAGLRNERLHLLEDVADSLGAILQASRLGIELERQLRAALAHAEEIAVSRRQAVAEMDSERRTIERDLHDGAQHHLVTLRLALGLVEHEVGNGSLESALDRLGQLTAALSTAETVLAKTATGVSSIVLSEQGLVAALRADLAGAEPPILVEDAGAPRSTPEVEAAVYFCCLESVNNARKHAGGATVAVRIWTEAGALRFTVRDEGPGFDPGALAGSAGRGMRNLRARVIAVGGDVTVESAIGVGTTVRGRVPLPTGVPAGPGSAGATAGPPMPGSDRVPAGPVMPVPPGAQPEPTIPEPMPMPMGPGPGPMSVPAAPAATPVPAPAPAPPTPTSPSVASSPIIAPALVVTEPSRSSLLAQVRGIARTALELSADRPERARLENLRARLDAPLRVGIVGIAGAGVSTLVAALSPHAPSSMCLLDDPELTPAESEDATPADALILLLRPILTNDPGRSDQPDDLGLSEALGRISGRHRPLPTIGVLARADELCGERPDAWEDAERAARQCQRDPDVRRVCQVVVPVAGLLAAATAALDEDQYQELRALGERSGNGAPDAGLVARFGVFGVRLAVELIRTGIADTPSTLSEELLRRSGLPQLNGLLGAQFAQRAEALKARWAMLELDALVRASGLDADWAERVLYQLEELRSGAHELAEIELYDALAGDTLMLSVEDRQAAEQLLGMTDGRPMARLGLADDAAPDEVHQAVGRQLAHWQRLASHPATTRSVRGAAEILVRTCEELLAHASAPNPTSVEP